MKFYLKAIFFSLAFITIMTFSAGAQAEDYPVKTVKGIVPYGAGGSTDVVFRAIVSDAKKYLGKGIVITNVSGAGGSVGGNRVAKSDADGYTLLLAPTSVVNIYPNLAERPAYNLGDPLVPVAVVTVDPRVWVVSADAPWDSVKELVEDAKKNPNTIRFGSPGITSWGAFGYYALASETEAEFVPVPLGGHSEIVASMLRGDVDVAAATYAGFKSQHDAGKFKVIGISSDERSEFLPEVPTVKEQGLDLPTDSNVRYVWVHKDVPEEAKNQLAEAFKGMCADQKVKERVARLNQNIEYHGRSEAMEIAKKEQSHFKGLIERFNLKEKAKVD